MPKQQRNISLGKLNISTYVQTDMFLYQSTITVRALTL